MSSTPDIDWVEARMRPGALSVSGFLGPHESLRDVLAADALAMRRARVTFEALAAALEALLAAASASRTREALVAGRHVRIQQYLGFQVCPWSPGPRSAQCVGGGLQFASLDWTIEILQTGDMLKGPGLLVHLMHDHHFCEGRESPYRVDPVALAKLLGLG